MRIAKVNCVHDHFIIDDHETNLYYALNAHKDFEDVLVCLHCSYQRTGQVVKYLITRSQETGR